MQNVLSGLVFVAFGLVFTIASWLGPDIGTAFRMGPGYLPLVLGILLILLGALITATPSGDDAAPARVNWRAVVLITAATVYFGLAMRTFGALPAVMGAVLLAGFADRTRLWVAMAVAVGLSAATIAIFVYGLGLPIPVLTFPGWG